MNISGEKPVKLDTLAKLFQTMRNTPVSYHGASQTFLFCDLILKMFFLCDLN